MLLLGCGPHIPSKTLPFQVIYFEKGRAFYQNTPFSGYAQTQYSNGNIESRTPFLNGLREGDQIEWYPDGQKKSSRRFHQGRKEGPQKGWWPNGTMQFKATCHHDTYEGVYLAWYDDKKPLKIMHYAKGHEVGRQQAFMQNGRASVNYIWKNNRIYGLKGDLVCETRTPNMH